MKTEDFSLASGNLRPAKEVRLFKLIVAMVSLYFMSCKKTIIFLPNESKPGAIGQ